MKIPHSIFITSVFLSFFIAGSQTLHAQNPKSPEKRKDVKSPVDSSWKKLSAGNDMFVNSQLFNPAGQSLDLAQGTRVMNVELARQAKFLVSKNNIGLSVIDADGFTVANQFEYEKDEAGTMYGLTVDGNESTVYFTGAQKNLYIGNIIKSGEFKLTKKIDLSVNKQTATPLGIGLVSKNIAYVALAIPNLVAVVDVAAGKALAKIPVGVCPYAIIISKDKKLAFVCNFGGPLARKGDKTE